MIISNPYLSKSKLTSINQNECDTQITQGILHQTS